MNKKIIMKPMKYYINQVIKVNIFIYLCFILADFSDQEEDYEDEKIQILDNKDDEYIPYIPK